MSGFGGIKNKYLAEKTTNFDRRESAKNTTEELSYTQKSFREMSKDSKYSNFIKTNPKVIKNYLSKNIDITKQLTEYRTELNKKYPDPKAKVVEEEPVAASPTKKQSAGGKRGKEVVEEAPVVEEPPKTERSFMDIDDVIDEGEIPDFTQEQQYMRGAPLSPEIVSKMESSPP